MDGRTVVGSDGLHFIFFFNDTATTELYTLPLHDALPICPAPAAASGARSRAGGRRRDGGRRARSEEHTSELQSRFELVCRLLPEKKNEAERKQAQLQKRAYRYSRRCLNNPPEGRAVFAVRFKVPGCYI